MNRHHMFEEATEIEAWMAPAIPFLIVIALLLAAMVSLGACHQEQPKHPVSPVAYLLK